MVVYSSFLVPCYSETSIKIFNTLKNKYAIIHYSINDIRKIIFIDKYYLLWTNECKLLIFHTTINDKYEHFNLHSEIFSNYNIIDIIENYNKHNNIIIVTDNGKKEYYFIYRIYYVYNICKIICDIDEILKSFIFIHDINVMHLIFINQLVTFKKNVIIHNQEIPIYEYELLIMIKEYLNKKDYDTGSYGKISTMNGNYLSYVNEVNRYYNSFYNFNTQESFVIQVVGNEIEQQIISEKSLMYDPQKKYFHFFHANQNNYEFFLISDSLYYKKKSMYNKPEEKKLYDNIQFFSQCFHNNGIFYIVREGKLYSAVIGAQHNFPLKMINSNVCLPTSMRTKSARNI